MPAPTVTLHEIFSSRQGEGVYTGDWMTFVRLQGCSLRCRWCDTPESLPKKIATYRIEHPPRSATFATRDNPLDAAQLTDLLHTFPDDTIALTGGEPLEQAAFLEHWLTHHRPDRKILLETGGVLTAALARIVPLIDIVSMDIKLPSSTGMKAYWREHAEFLRIATQSAAETYVKMVITSTTDLAELAQAVELIAAIDPDCPTFLQIASPTADCVDVPDSEWLRAPLMQHQRLLPRLVIGTQMHKTWGIL